MTIRSRDKGARFERELASKLKARGYNCRRGQADCGEIGDRVVEGIPEIHIEAKHQEKMQLYDWVWQAKRDAKPDEIPAVFHKRNNCEILVTTTFEDWMKIYEARNDTKEEQINTESCD